MMDLVASYGSEESENEGIKILKANLCKEKNLKEVDVINLDESDTDEPKIISESKGIGRKASDNSRCSKEIDCIQISDSEDLLEEKKDVDKKAEEKDSKSGKESSTEKIDYLNLEDENSEDEKQVPSNNVNELLNCASILSNNACGPSKSFEHPEQQTNYLLSENRTISRSSISRSSFSSQTLDRTVSTPDSMPTPAASPYDRTYETIDSDSRKRIKIDNNIEFHENHEDIVHSDTNIYRKDVRVTEGHCKNVVCRIPRQMMRTYIGHTNVVTALSWCIPQYSHLLLSASADCTLKVWDIFCSNPVRHFRSNSGLKAAKWSLDGEQIIAGGFGKKAHVFDVLSGKEIVMYDVYNYVTSLEIHPYMEDVILCGTRNAILGYDLRVNSALPIRSFFSKCEEVLDIAFLDENEFICSTNVVSNDSADRTIMAWDFASGAILSNQIFLERYTCPSLKVHPNDSSFVAQTNGDYIAAFSTSRPYKIRNKRYSGHKVSGFGIECDISPDGKYLASGDADGDLYFYNYLNTSFIHKMTAKQSVPTNRLKWHPALSSTMATATWDGHLQIWR